MRILFLLMFFIFLNNCGKNVVMICGDHECINDKEAQKYFDENFIIEVKVLEKKKERYFDLVKINTDIDNNEKKIAALPKIEKTKIRKLNKNEKREILKNLKKDKKINSIEKSRKIDKNKVKKIKKLKKSKKTNLDKKLLSKETNICEIIDKCNINEISKYLIKKGEKAKYPDISSN